MTSGFFQRPVRGRWGQDEELQTPRLAGGFELGGELAAAVDLQGAQGEGQARAEGVEEAGGEGGGGAGVRLKDIPARNHVAGGDLLDGHAGQRAQLQRVDLDQVAGRLRPLIAGFAPGAGRRTPPRLEVQGGRFDQQAARLQAGENMPPHRSGDGPALPAQQHGQLILAPARILPPQA